MKYKLNIVQPVDQNAYNAYNFSEELMQLISGVYSTNIEVASANFDAIVRYFAKGFATAEEVDFLVMTNDNPIAYLLYALEDSNPGPYAFLGKMVDQVVKATLQSERDNAVCDVTLKPGAEEIDIMGDYSEMDA